MKEGKSEGEKEREKERGRERERKRASVLDVETIIELEEADHWVNNK